jgi:hypothetical protein
MKLNKTINALIALMILVFCTSVPIDAQEPSLTYDLLILGRSTDTNSASHASISEYSLFFLDTTTWEITPLDVDWKPLGGGALSPDEHLLGVYHHGDLCLMNADQAFELCVPADEVLFCTAGPETFCPNEMQHIFWDEDSQSFWVRLTNSFSQIDTVDGAILQSLFEYDDGASRFQRQENNPPHFVYDFLPSAMLAHTITEPCSTIIDTSNNRSYSLDPYCYGWKSLSPDAAFVTVLYYIVPLTGMNYQVVEDEYIVSEDEYIWYCACTQSPLTCTDPFLPRLWGDPQWSHDSQMFAYRCDMRPSVNVPYESYEGGLWFYDLESGQKQIVAEDEIVAEWGELSWSPDDNAIAQLLYSPETSLINVGLAVTLLNGENHIISLPLPTDDASQAEIYFVTWIPRGWLQLDELQQ